MRRLGAAAYGWTAPERTRIEYPTAEAALTPADEERPRSVAGYVSGDPRVVRIYIDGHTDDIGGERDNLGLSRHRAEQVREFLASCGVLESRLVVRYHGARLPATSPSISVPAIDAQPCAWSGNGPARKENSRRADRL